MPFTLPDDQDLLSAGIPAERISVRKRAATAPGPVVYWMQASQRAACNHALEYAILAARKNRAPVFAVFVLDTAFPGANLRHFHFMLEGLAETARALSDRGIPLCVFRGNPATEVPRAARGAALLVMDRAYTRLPVAWRQTVLDAVSCPVTEIESDVIVPVESASDHEEYAARTIRPKILRQLPRFLIPLHQQEPPRTRAALPCAAAEPATLPGLAETPEVDRSVAPSARFHGGYGEARSRLRRFLEDGLARYDDANDPTADAVSLLSPFLHFGQIAPLEIALAVRDTESPQAAAFLEQLIVRRELAVNFVYYRDHYDTFDCLPDWARGTLSRHQSDRRDYLYDTADFEAARTHDDAWNAAQRELLDTGHMAGYMRMYWGKKVLEWSATPEAAYRTLIYLNDRYELDGRDPNGHAGVAWCFGKHDRPWGERPVFGTIRFMNAAGLRRKFDVDAYIAAWAPETCPQARTRGGAMSEGVFARKSRGEKPRSRR